MELSGRTVVVSSHDLADIEQLLARFDIDSIAIVGMSQGARVALRWASYSPRATRCLILDGPPRDILAAGRPEGEITLAAYRGLVREQGIEAFRTQWLQHPLMRLHDNSRQPLLRRIVARYPGRDLTGTGDAAGPAADVAAIATRALVINGEQDSPARLIAGDDLARRLPDASHVTVAGAGHLPNLDNPERYNALVRAFVRGNA